MNPTIEYLNECFICDPVAGTLVWRQRPREHFALERIWLAWNKRFAGKLAGGLSRGRLFVHIKEGYGNRGLHRVIWAMTKGAWPVLWIDHANGDPLDNRIENLREATPAQNNYNRAIQHNSKSGFKGVYKRKDTQRYQACIRVNKKPIVLGYFRSAEEASEAYQAAALKYHGEFAKKNLQPLRR